MYCYYWMCVYGTYDAEIRLIGIQVINYLLLKLGRTGASFANIDQLTNPESISNYIHCKLLGNIT